MGLLEETLRGRSLADYTNSELKIALNTALYTNTADMWSRYLVQQGYSGSVADMMAKWWADNKVPAQFRNYINSGLYLFSPQNLFAANEPGYLYDLDDLSTVFLDSAGTTPASVNGLVGLVLDKSRGLALGAERLTGEGTASGSFTYVSDVINRNGSTTGAAQSTAVATVGKGYLVTFTVSNLSGDTIFVRSGGVNSGNITANGTYTLRVVASSATTVFQVNPWAGTAGEVTVSGISVKELAGNHRYQATTGSKPILRGTPTGGNIITNGGFDTSAGWITTNSAAVSGGKGIVNGATGSALLYQNANLVSGRWYRASFDIDAITGTLNIWDNSGAVKASFTTTGRKEVYFQHANANSNFLFQCNNGANSATVDNVDVRDVSADSVTTPYALQYDGVDDFLQTAAVDFTSTDKVTVCHGVRKLSDAALSILVEFSSNLFLNNGAFVMYAPTTTSPNYGFFSKGTAVAGVAQTGYTSPVTNVIAGIGNISSDGCVLRVNGVQVASASDDQGTGNFGNYPFYFGRRAGTASPYNGLEFSSICIGRLLTAAELANTERWVARKTGLTL